MLRSFNIPSLLPRIGLILGTVAFIQACQEVPEVQVPTSAVSMVITSPVLQANEPIPPQYTCDGRNTSPPLDWTNIPNAAQSLVLIMDDPDAPNGTFLHWLFYDLPSTVDTLPGAIIPASSPEQGGSQGRNGFNKIGYGGPCPPNGTHRYRVKLYALDKTLDLPSDATLANVAEAMEGHIVGFGELTAPYTRQSY